MSRTPYRSSPRTRAEATSPAQVITNAIIARLEAGVSPWRKPWTSSGGSIRPKRVGDEFYRGINAIYLWAVAEVRGYAFPTWMTYRQSEELGGQVRRGERGTLAVFYKSYGATERDDQTGEESATTRRVLRSYTVFNVDQIDGLPDRFTPPPPPPRVFDESHRAEIDAFVAASGARVVIGGNEACYIPSLDVIHMPRWQDFDSYASYGATVAHELSHWTGHSSRLSRDLDRSLNAEGRATEELVAELSSAMLGDELGLPVAHLDDHANYIGHWIKLLKNDERALLTAAARAEEAADYLLRLAGRRASVDHDEDAEPLQLAA